MTVALIAALRVGDEGQEGMAAFFERRPPGWSPRARSSGDATPAPAVGAPAAATHDAAHTDEADDAVDAGREDA